jgi:nitrous oxidase accessory protein NosD
MRRNRMRLAAFAAAIAGLVVAAPAEAKTISVAPGQSIQAAINSARSGDTIRLQPGVYKQSLLIKKSGLTLTGRHAVLTDPSKAQKIPCNMGGKAVGVCVVGKGNFQKGTVTKRVKNVRITHLTLRGFGGEGVFGFGTRNLRVDHSRLSKNGGYGAFSLASKGTVYANDVATGNAAPGLYVGDSPGANATIRNSRSTKNLGEGILLRHASGGSVHNNVLSGNCAGLSVLADAPGPAGGFTISKNAVTKNTRKCAGNPSEGEPPVSGVGIGLLGAFKTTVSGNTVKGNVPTGPSDISGGIVAGAGPQKTPPKNDVIKGNNVDANNPFDLLWDGTGSVTFSKNLCRTSSPAGLCTGTPHK